jgi:hypothetical protein
MTDGISLSDAIKMLRAELIKARDAGRDDDIQFPVESLTLELQVVATRTKNGTAGFQVPILNVGGSIGSEKESTQTVTVVFGAPLDQSGRPAKIARRSDEILG